MQNARRKLLGVHFESDQEPPADSDSSAKVRQLLNLLAFSFECPYLRRPNFASRRCSTAIQLNESSIDFTSYSLAGSIDSGERNFDTNVDNRRDSTFFVLSHRFNELIDQHINWIVQRRVAHRDGSSFSKRCEWHDRRDFNSSQCSTGSGGEYLSLVQHLKRRSLVQSGCQRRSACGIGERGCRICSLPNSRERNGATLPLCKRVNRSASFESQHEL